jgi:hypothetical protein
MNLPLFELIEKSYKDLFNWVFRTLLFSTTECRCEAERYFTTGRTSFKFLEWLSPGKMRVLYPQRWKAVMADYAGAYLKLVLFGFLVGIGCLVSAGIV